MVITLKALHDSRGLYGDRTSTAGGQRLPATRVVIIWRREGHDVQNGGGVKGGSADHPCQLR